MGWEVTKLPEDREYGERIDEFLRYLRGRGPRPGIEGLPQDEQTELEDLFRVLEAIVDADEPEMPPIDEDPVAARLGLVEGDDGKAGVAAESDPITASLEELVHRLGSEIEVTTDVERSVSRHDVNGLLPARAVCRTLGEVVLICTTEQDDFLELPHSVALVFADRPAATAIAVVSSASNDALVFTEADCVRAVDPTVGWVDPALPRAPEPLELALGRYLEGSLPRWDEVARLDEMLIFTGAEDVVASSAREALNDILSRSARLPAKKTALEQLRDFPPTPVESVVNEVRLGRLASDGLLQRLRELSEADSP
jgi:hypothetical protein